MIKALQNKAKKLKSELLALSIAVKDPRVKWYVKLLLSITIAYALSPIDLIPDFIPVLGYLDDLILVPLGIALVIRLIPPFVMEESRLKAAEISEKKLKKKPMFAVIIIMIWILCFIWLYQIISKLIK